MGATFKTRSIRLSIWLLSRARWPRRPGSCPRHLRSPIERVADLFRPLAPQPCTWLPSPSRSRAERSTWRGHHIDLTPGPSPNRFTLRQFWREGGTSLDSRPSTWQKETVMSLEELYNWQGQIRAMIGDLGYWQS